MARILGLDIGAHSVKALLLDSNIRGFSVVSYSEQIIQNLEPGQPEKSPDAADKQLDKPEERQVDGSPNKQVGEKETKGENEVEAGLAAALERLRADGYFNADQVVVAVPGHKVAVHLLTLPFTDPKRIDATIGFEVEGQLPYDLAEVVFDYQVVGSKNGKSDVLVATVRKEDLKSTLESLASFGADPRVVTTSALAYQGLITSKLTKVTSTNSQISSSNAEAIVDIGHERTSVCIAVPGRGVEYARTFAGGGKDLSRAIASEFKVSLADAETWKNNEADISLTENLPPEVERAAKALLQGIAPIIREIRATLRAHSAKSRRPVKRIWIAGGTSRIAGLEALLSRELNVEVAKLDAIPENCSVIPENSKPVAAQAFSLAIRGHGARAARINFRKDDFAFKGDLDYLKGKSSRIAAFAGVLVFLSLALVFAKFHVLNSAEAELDKALCTMTERVLNKCQKDYTIALSMLKGKNSPAASLPTYSALNIFDEIINRSQNASVKLDSIEIQLDRVRLGGETGGFDGIDKLVATLKEFKCFQEIKRGKVQKNKDGSKVQFDLDIRVQCGEGEGRKAAG